MSTVAYVSIGRGYGTSGQANTELGASRSDWYAANKGILSTKFRNADGTFAYDQMEELNEQSMNGSLYALSISKNYHNWYGLVSTYTTKFGEYVDFMVALTSVTIKVLTQTKSAICLVVSSLWM